MDDGANPHAWSDLGSEPGVCATCAVRSSSICGALSSDEIAALNTISRRKTLEPGQFHVFEGDAARDFANVTGGVGKLVRGAEDGRAQIVGLLFPSDFIGGNLRDSDAEELQSIEAVSTLELCLFPRAAFTDVLHCYPTLERRLLDRTLSELQLAREWMVLLGRKTAGEKVASFILHVADRMQNSGCQGRLGFDLPLSRADIADHVGLTIETVSRQITKLRREGIIEMSGNKHVLSVDRARLQECAGF